MINRYLQAFLIRCLDHDWSVRAVKSRICFGVDQFIASIPPWTASRAFEPLRIGSFHTIQANFLLNDSFCEQRMLKNLAKSRITF